MDRKNRPSPIPASPSMPQPTIDLTNNILTARLPSGDSTTIHLYGATVTSWTTANGTEQLFLSTAAALDGSKPIRGGVPLVFPVFGPPPKDHTTGGLPQHGFARNSMWEFLGKTSSESTGKKADDSVKLDFGLGPQQLSEGVRGKWPYEFGLVYSVTLGKGRLECSMLVKNEGKEVFEFQTLFHTYLQIKVRTRSSSCWSMMLTHHRTYRKSQFLVSPTASTSIKSAVPKSFKKTPTNSPSKARQTASTPLHYTPPASISLSQSMRMANLASSSLEIVYRM